MPAVYYYKNVGRCRAEIGPGGPHVSGSRCSSPGNGGEVRQGRCACRASSPRVRAANTRRRRPGLVAQRACSATSLPSRWSWYRHTGRLAINCASPAAAAPSRTGWPGRLRDVERRHHAPQDGGTVARECVDRRCVDDHVAHVQSNRRRQYHARKRVATGSQAGEKNPTNGILRQAAAW